MTIFDAAERYSAERVPLIIVAGEAYGIGSARDWAAKGTRGLGVQVVLAASFERIHRANLALVGVLPLQWVTKPIPALQPQETISIDTPSSELEVGMILTLQVHDDKNRCRVFKAKCRLDTKFEIECWKSGGMLSMVASR